MSEQQNSSAATEDALLPCPFCGGEPAKIASHVSVEAVWQIRCEHDECLGPHTTAASEQDATAQWNTRVGGKMKPIYVKRWRTLFMVPSSLATEIRDTLRSLSSDVAQSAPVNAAALTESLIQAAVDYEAGRIGRPALSAARAAVEAAIAQPPAAPVETKPFYGAECPSYPNCNGGCGLGCTHEVERHRRSSAGTGDVKAAQAVELANKIDLHLTLSNSSPGFHLSEEELQMAAAALRFAAMSAVPQGAPVQHVKMEHPYRPAEADYEYADMVRRINTMGGPGVVVGILQQYAFASPSQGSFAGSLWAIAEWLNERLPALAMTRPESK